MAIVSDIIYGALRLCGIRDTTNATLIAEALTAFNDMRQSWEESLRHATTTESFTLTAATASYTIGSGGDFDTARPTKIESAFIRDSSGIDYPVDVTMTRKEYNEISDKDAAGRPSKLYYDPQNTLGYIYFDTAPESAETFYITSYKPYTEYAAITDTITEPVNYEKAMKYNLAIDLAPEYNIQLIPTVIEQAIILKNEILNRNSTPIPTASFDSALLR